VTNRKWRKIAPRLCIPGRCCHTKCLCHNLIHHQSWPGQQSKPGGVPKRSPVILRSSGTLNKMITVDGGGHSSRGQSRRDELQHSHLRCSVLHGHTVCTTHVLLTCGRILIEKCRINTPGGAGNVPDQHSDCSKRRFLTQEHALPGRNLR